MNKVKLLEFHKMLANAWQLLHKVEDELHEAAPDGLLDDEWETISMMVADLDDVMVAFESAAKGTE